MDPFTFATIVSLMAAFKSSRDGKQDRQDMNEFKEWLIEKNHRDMVTLIENNGILEQNLTSFMNQNHDQVMNQLSTLNDLMISIATHIKGLNGIASSFESNNGLSPQAVDVLRQFVEVGGREIRVIETHDAYNSYYFDNDYSNLIEYSEPNFIEDDLSKLSEAGLLTLVRSSKGKPIYKITRQAVAFIEAIDNKN